MYLKLKDGIEIPIKHLEESMRFRRVEQLLLILIEGNYSINEILNIFTKENISEITLVDDNNNSKIFYQYKSIESLSIEYDDNNFDLNKISLSLIDKENEE